MKSVNLNQSSFAYLLKRRVPADYKVLKNWHLKKISFRRLRDFLKIQLYQSKGKVCLRLLGASRNTTRLECFFSDQAIVMNTE